MWDADLGSIPPSHGQMARKGSTRRVHVNDRPLLVVRESGKDRADDEMAPADCLNDDLEVNWGDDRADDEMAPADCLNDDLEVNWGDDNYQNMEQLSKEGVLVGPIEEMEN